MAFSAGTDPVVVGYILPEKDNVSVADEDSENEVEEEEEKQPEFLDITEMDSVGSGECVFKSSAPVLREVDLMVSGQKMRVEGRFALRDPWWEITCPVRHLKRKCVLKGYPAYRLRTDLKDEGRSIVALFLKACGVDPSMVTQFMEWLPEGRHVELTNVLDALRDFGECREDKKDVVDCTIRLISKSDAGFIVRVANKYPGFMKYVPALLPGRFLELLKKEKEEEKKVKEAEAEVSSEAPPQSSDDKSVLARLEQLTDTDIWKFGFSYIMHKEFHLLRCEAKLSDYINSRLFWNLEPQQQNALLVYDDLKTYCRAYGHTYIDLSDLEERMQTNKTRQIHEEETWQAVHFLREQGVLKVERQKVALRNFYNYEREIISCLDYLMTKEPWIINLDVKEVLLSAQRRRMRAKTVADGEMEVSVEAGEEHGLPNFDSSIKQEPDPTPTELDPDQVRAAEMMCTKPVTVISGKGGCGKTTVVSLIFKAAMELQKDCKELDGTCEDNEEKENKSEIEVLLTAPTGKAASLLTKRTSFTAYTMHQVLFSYMTTKKHESGEPVNWKFSSVRVLVVDEGSLVCVQMLHSILTMLIRHAQLQKFIILGDIRQLPSIEPGNILNDLFHSLRKVGSAIEMRTNHRAESELIVRNAGLIADMGMKRKYSYLEFDAFVDLSKPIPTMPSPEKRFILVRLPEEEGDDDLQQAILTLLKGQAPGLKDDKTSQFVAFRRAECALINELCCKHYSDHLTTTHKRRIDFQKGDKVCCTKNGYVTDKDKEEEKKEKNNKESPDVDSTQSKEQKSKERLCNGEIFFITEDVTVEEVGLRRSKRRFLTLDDGEGRVVVADFRELQRECKLRHAWARTIHTFQGSEAETIVYVLGDGYRQTWKHVYTAVTRGQKRVYVIVKERGLQTAIGWCDKTRLTRLEGLTMELVAKLGITRDDVSTQMAQTQSSKHESVFQSCQPTQPSFTKIRYAKGYYNRGDGQSWYSPRSQNGGLKGNPSPCKRQNSSDECVTPTKQLKTTTTESPLGCSKMESLSLSPKRPARQLFPQTLHSHQDQQQNQ